MPNMSQQEIIDNTHYVVHVRVEKVVINPNGGGLKIVDTGDRRSVEEVLNVVRKASFLSDGVDFIKGVLDLAGENE